MGLSTRGCTSLVCCRVLAVPCNFCQVWKVWIPTDILIATMFHQNSRSRKRYLTVCPKITQHYVSKHSEKRLGETTRKSSWLDDTTQDPTQSEFLGLSCWTIYEGQMLSLALRGLCRTYNPTAIQTPLLRIQHAAVMRQRPDRRVLLKALLLPIEKQAGSIRSERGKSNMQTRNMVILKSI